MNGTSTLGGLVKIHRVRTERVAIPLALGMVLLLASAWALLHGRMSPLVYALVLLLTWCILMLDLIPAVSRVVEVKEQGLRISALASDVSLRWDELDALHITAKLRPLPLPGEAPVWLSVRAHAGDAYGTVDDDLEQFDELYARLLDELEKRLEPSLRRAFEAGETVWFGLLSASRGDGLSCADERWSWSELTQATIDLGVLQLDGRRACWAHQVANLPVLLRLLRERGVDVAQVEQTLRLER